MLVCKYDLNELALQLVAMFVIAVESVGGAALLEEVMFLKVDFEVL